MAESERKLEATRQPGQQEIQIDDSKVAALYANFCRVTGTPEELVVDFSLNALPAEQITGPIVLSQRIVLSFFTAKRLFQALGMSLQRHEQAFGPIETNVQKRVVPQQQAPQQPPRPQG